MVVELHCVILSEIYTVAVTNLSGCYYPDRLSFGTLAKGTEHRRRLRGGVSPGTCLPIIEKRSCIYHFLPPFASPDILVCPPNIFDKSTPVGLSGRPIKRNVRVGVSAQAFTV